jgi:hypothetical protein
MRPTISPRTAPACSAGDIYGGTQTEWEAADWLDADTLRQIQWFGLTEEEKARAELLARAMERARRSNPLAY